MRVRILHFPNLQVNAKVYVNGQFAGVVNPFSPFVDISELSHPGEIVRIAVVMEQHLRRPAGEVLLYQGISMDEWMVAGWREEELANQAEQSYQAADQVSLPVSLPKGGMAWLHGELPLSMDWDRGWRLQFIGHELKISACIGTHMVGRIWLPSEMRPRMAAGLDDRIILPSDWLRKSGGRLHLLVENVSDKSSGELREIKLILDV